MENLKNSNFKENDFGVHDTFKHGFFNVKSDLSPGNKLEYQEKNFTKCQEKNLLSSIRTSRGLYAPFIFEMEKKFSSKVSRLPALKSSQLMESVLNGTDDIIDVQNILNNQREFCEHNYDLHSLNN